LSIRGERYGVREKGTTLSKLLLGAMEKTIKKRTNLANFGHFIPEL
jgi:hypothetical protein